MVRFSLRLLFHVLWAALAGLLASPSARAQLCQTSHTSDLYCLLPASFHTLTSPFSAVFTPLGTQLSQLPVEPPAGLVLTFEHGLLVPSNESLGSVFAQRAETLGTRRIFVGLTYQNFGFGSLDGNHLKDLPIVLYYPPGQIYTVSTNRLNVRAGQYTAAAAIGLTRRLDVTVAVPFANVTLAASINGEEYGPGGASAAVHEYVPGQAAGLSDVLLGAKQQVLDWRKLRVAAGLLVRLPTGDELNFLGTGTPGLQPYVALDREGKLSPHLNTGYQWNGHSILNPTAAGGKQQLPPDFFYTAGVNWQPTRRWTLIADLVGRRYLHEPRLTSPQPISIPGLGTAPSVEPYTGVDTTDDLALGFKTNTFFHLVATGNLSVKLDNGGLRAKVSPLAGLAYSF